MAVLEKPRIGSVSGSHGVRRKDFDKLVSTCENPPKAPQSLRELVAFGASLLKKG